MLPAVTPPIVLHDLRLVYLVVAKAACSSVKTALARLCGLKIPEPWWKIHDLPFPFALPQVAAALLHSGYHGFAVVRHPLDRLHAVWTHKFCPERFADLRQHHNLLQINMSFPQFVQALRRVNLSTANEHLRPQYKILAPYPAERVRLLHFESLAADWATLRQSHSKLPDLPHVNSSDHSPWATAYDDATRSLAWQLYAGDARFGYTR